MSITNTPTQDSSFNQERRKTLTTLGSFSLLSATSLVGCGGGSSSTPTPQSANSSNSSRSSQVNTSSAASSAGSCRLIPNETLGPFPLSTLLDNSLVLRENIAEDKTGVPLQVKIKLVNVNNNCTPISAYVYIWHCDKDGTYSGYSQTNNPGQAGKTYCRGVQYTDTNGVAQFTSIFPGWYAGRITHIHFQVFLSAYGSSAQSTAVSQMAFPAETVTEVYNSPLYRDKGQNTSVKSFSADNVFSDGVEYQLANISGDITNGLLAELEVGIIL